MMFFRKPSTGNWKMKRCLMAAGKRTGLVLVFSLLLFSYREHKVCLFWEQLKLRIQWAGLHCTSFHSVQPIASSKDFTSFIFFLCENYPALPTKSPRRKKQCFSLSAALASLRFAPSANTTANSNDNNNREKNLVLP